MILRSSSVPKSVGKRRSIEFGVEEKRRLDGFSKVFRFMFFLLGMPVAMQTSNLFPLPPNMHLSCNRYLF